MIVRLHAGYHLLARMFGQVTYVSRSEYANRQAMFDKHIARATDVAGPDSKVPDDAVLPNLLLMY